MYTLNKKTILLQIEFITLHDKSEHKILKINQSKNKTKTSFEMKNLYNNIIQLKKHRKNF